MKNNFYSFGILILSLFLMTGTAIAQDQSLVRDVDNSTGPSQFNYSVGLPIITDGAGVLYDNGPFINVPGGGPEPGSDLSLLENVALSMTTLGFGHQFLNGYRMADEFTVPSPGWIIDEVKFYAYQTNSGFPTSTMTGVYLQIWDGDPSAGGSVIWGDLVTNVMTATTFTNAFRHSETTVNNARPIMEQTALVGTTLSPGTYWFDWMTDGSAASGPWAPPIAILGQTTTGNALQWTGAWGSALDGGTLTPQGMPFIIMGSIIPVELTSFAASVNEDEVVLNWSTATETNNQGFEIQRKSAADFQTVGFAEGHGTTTEIQNYSFTDSKLEPGTYTYRLKQIDYNGSFEYSNSVEAEIIAPAEFSLKQNYPNPFNPATVIKFSLAVDSRVTLRLFNVLGEEIAILLQTDLSAGSQEINFDASNLTSGVYLYRLEAAGIDGSSFTSTKKMILNK